MQVISNKYKLKIQELIQKEAFHHILFWILLYLFLVLVDRTDFSVYLKLTKEFINVCLYALMVYFNILYLIPQFLSKKRLLIYISTLVITALVITPFKILPSYLLFNDTPQMQELYATNQHLFFVLFLLVGIISTIYKIMVDWFLHQRETKELQNQNLQSELKFLRSQINPHFLFNTLNNLYSLTLKKSDLAPDMVLRLSEMMRYMLYECNEPQVPLEKELNYLKNYLELEKIRQGKNVMISLDIDGDAENQKIAPLIFIPFIENSFKHGLNQSIESGFVNINMLINEDKLEVSIENSKATTNSSFQLHSQKKSGGIGLENIKRRLNLLYPEKHLLNIDDRADIFSINLKLELN